MKYLASNLAKTSLTLILLYHYHLTFGNSTSDRKLYVKEICVPGFDLHFTLATIV